MSGVGTSHAGFVVRVPHLFWTVNFNLWAVIGTLGYITPLLDQLSLLHNFTIESQVQYHAPLAFKPRPSRLSSEDLSVFVNSAEWSLCESTRSCRCPMILTRDITASSASNDPVLHFVAFIPSQPLEMPESFLLPQWGGIVVHDPPSLSVDDVFPIFARQLLSLLGVSPLPAGVNYTGDVPISRWQLEALLRQRTLENTHSSQDTLRSIVTLVDQIEGMPVGWNVKDDILDALNALDKVCYPCQIPILVTNWVYVYVRAMLSRSTHLRRHHCAKR